MTAKEFALYFVDRVKGNDIKCYLNKNEMILDHHGAIRFRNEVGYFCPLTLAAYLDFDKILPYGCFRKAAEMYDISFNDAGEITSAADHDRLHDPELRQILEQSL